MTVTASDTSHLKEAVVITASRRHLIISADGHNLIKGISSTKSLETVVGDRVLFSEEPDQPAFIHCVKARKNYIARSYQDEVKLVAANLDHLFVVAAVLPLFNTVFIDRILAVAHSQNIPATLLVNKIDLGVESITRLVDIYSALGFKVLLASAKFGAGLDDFRSFLAEPAFSTVALAGISGVGKSTFVNQLIPGSNQQTNEVSGRTGGGKQTTSQAFGFLYERSGNAGVLMIDLPGIQSFGVNHLSLEQIQASFPEMVEFGASCGFDNCGHRYENDCAVKAAVANGEIADCRYQSYLNMLDELDRSRQY